MTQYRHLVEVRYSTHGDRSWLVPTNDETWVEEMRAAADDPGQRYGPGPRWLTPDGDLRYVPWEDVIEIRVDE